MSNSSYIGILGKTAASLAVATAVLLSAGYAEDLEVSGSAGLELRTFVQHGPYPEQLETFQPSVLLEGEISWREGAWDFYVAPFVRMDMRDDARTHADLREAYVGYRSDSFGVRAGFLKVYWGVAESRHLVDILNQWDFVEDIDREDKLGLPALELTHHNRMGDFAFYVSPFFRERRFPDAAGRFRLPVLIDGRSAEFEGCDTGHCGVDIAFHYSQVFGDFDLGLSFFDGFDRDPRFIPDPGGEEFSPHYDRITQTAIDLQLTKSAWLWKFEGLYRDTALDSYWASVFGLEYSFYGLIGGADLGLIIEWQYDGRSKDPSLAPTAIEDNDIFTGFRLALNDVADTSAIVGLVTDLGDGSAYGSMEFSRRIGDQATLEIESRFFISADPHNQLYPFRRDSNVTVRFIRYF